MLVELQSDAFKIGNEIRETIVFHKGLNAVVATNSDNNSVGKTSFLLALDFVFGGDTYKESEVGITENVGHHTLNFAFDFGNGIERFSRSTQTPDIVTICGESYADIKENISLKEYREKLSACYKLENLGITFREAVSPFLRISHKSPSSLKEFLKDASGEYAGKGVGG